MRGANSLHCKTSLPCGDSQSYRKKRTRSCPTKDVRPTSQEHPEVRQESSGCAIMSDNIYYVYLHMFSAKSPASMSRNSTIGNRKEFAKGPVQHAFAGNVCHPNLALRSLRYLHTISSLSDVVSPSTDLSPVRVCAPVRPRRSPDTRDTLNRPAHSTSQPLKISNLAHDRIAPATAQLPGRLRKPTGKLLLPRIRLPWALNAGGAGMIL